MNGSILVVLERDKTELSFAVHIARIAQKLLYADEPLRIVRQLSLRGVRFLPACKACNALAHFSNPCRGKILVLQPSR